MLHCHPAEGIACYHWAQGLGSLGLSLAAMLPLPHISAPFGFSRPQLKSRTEVHIETIAQLFNSIKL